MDIAPDEQLYALALYLYSLEPPANPNPYDDEATRGELIFNQQGCAGCHPAPLYTNNKLTPVRGFTVPDALRKTDAILDVSAGADPGLALETRRGTGFYKVPSLRGVWMRPALGHEGQAYSLEEWFDPARFNAQAFGGSRCGLLARGIMRPRKKRKGQRASIW